MRTTLNKWYNDANGVYTRDMWIIPDEGVEIWCTAWPRGQHITPYGDGSHVVLGLIVYHCDELMSILARNERDGYTWGIGVPMARKQKINGDWRPIKI